MRFRMLDLCRKAGLLALSLALCAPPACAEDFQIARLKYGGGGDWYSDPTSLPNLLAFTRRQTGLQAAPREAVVEAGDPELYRYPYLYLTGHGQIRLDELERRRLRSWLLGGGFLHVDDNYGLDTHIRREFRALFPELELQEVPFEHPIYSSVFDYSRGLPKIHEHDKKPPRGFGLFDGERLMVFYTWECDLGDGWEDELIHNNPPEIRRQALEMGCNILSWAMGAGAPALSRAEGGRP